MTVSCAVVSDSETQYQCFRVDKKLCFVLFCLTDHKILFEVNLRLLVFVFMNGG